MTNVSVLVNQLTSLFCEVGGSPPPAIMWYKDDVQVSEDIWIYAEFLASTPEKIAQIWIFLTTNNLNIWLEFLVMHFPQDWKERWPLWPLQVTESSTIQILNNGKTLKLLKVTAEDAGRFSCKAVNIAGTAQKHFTIDVLGKGNILLKNHNSDAFLTLHRGDCRQNKYIKISW